MIKYIDEFDIYNHNISYIYIKLYILIELKTQ